MAPQATPQLEIRAAALNDSATVGVAQAVNDTIDFRIPKGFELSMLRLAWTDMDTNGSPAMAAKVGFAPINGSTVVSSSAIPGFAYAWGPQGYLRIDVTGAGHGALDEAGAETV